MKSENRLKVWIRNHKTKLIIAGTTISAVVVGILLIRKWEYIEALLASNSKLIEPDKSPELLCDQLDLSPILSSEGPVNPTSEFVREAVRRLPAGQKASIRAKENALEYGVVLDAEHTFVLPYTRQHAA